MQVSSITLIDRYGVYNRKESVTINTDNKSKEDIKLLKEALRDALEYKTCNKAVLPTRLLRVNYSSIDK